MTGQFGVVLPPPLLTTSHHEALFLNSFSAPLTLEMNVLMLMNFPVHVGVCVRVNVSVDFGIDLGRDGSASLVEKELLLCQILLVVHCTHAVFVRAGRARRRRGAASLPLATRRDPVGDGGGGGGGGAAGRGALLSTLAEPEQHGAEDEDDSGGDADDDGPGQGAGGRRKDGHDGGLGVYKRGHHKENAY